MTSRAFLAAVAATASLAACGSDGSSPASADPEAANRKSMLDFARCMREHGVDMPDPQFESGGRTKQMGPKDADPDKMRAGEKACEKYRKQVKGPALSADQKEEFRKAALANSRCMREHGINMPDPTFDENGGAQIKMDSRNGVDPDSAKFKAAEKACESTLPRRVTTGADGER